MCERSVLQVECVTSVCCMPQHEQVCGTCGIRACTESVLSWVHGAKRFTTVKRLRALGCCLVGVWTAHVMSVCGWANV